MQSYISAITLEINGAKLDDFNTFTDGKRELKKAVHLMNGTGKVKVTQRYNFSLDYVIPSDKTEFDFAAVEDGTVTLDYENGKRISYGEVECLTIGETKYDGDKEATRTIEFIAGTRTEQ